MMKAFPFKTEKALVDNATRIWYDECRLEDWEEALRRHPNIGDIIILTKKFADQAAELTVSETSLDVVRSLKYANEEYEKQNRFTFLMSATGKTAGEMLHQLINRLFNTREEELDIAMGEQHKVTIFRLKRMFKGDGWSQIHGSQITTNVLDTSSGKPATGMTVRLKDMWKGSWQTIAQGVTNAEGSIFDFLPPGRMLEPGNYQLVFETGDYFKDNKKDTFYPQTELQITIGEDGHYHVPLLINPTGYSTYRGS